ncbi:MAG: ABC transporter permease [Pseudomonadota bacterium]
MFHFRRFYAILVARNLEFVRDYASLGWGLVFPIFIVVGFAFIFNNQQPLYTVGSLGPGEVDATELLGLESTLVDIAPQSDRAAAIRKVERHGLDLLIEPSEGRYWINPRSPNGIVLEKVLRAEGSVTTLSRLPVSGEALRYVDWALPGVLAMNIMFAALYGIGFVIVRYRKMGVLKRLLATPVSAVEFLSAQLVSRLLLILVVNTLLFVGLWATVNFRMEGSALLLLLVFAVGSTSLIAMGLLIAARISSEELANGLLNIATWPMMLLSEVWFSMDDAAPWLQRVADALPLTHMTRSARAIMLDAASFTDVLPSLLYLGGVTVVLLLIGAALFRWET